MSPNEKERKSSAIKLLPHQSAFIETFFNPASKRVILLRAAVGLGKSLVLVALASRVLRERPRTKILILVPAALRLRFAEMLREAGAPSLLVDRYRFREMLDSTTGGEFWPPGVVVLLSLDFAKQSDIQDSLAETTWDLIISDEAQAIHGTRADALRKIGASAERVVLATATDLQAPDVFPAEDTMWVHWRRDQVVDYQGRSLDSAPRPQLHEVQFDFNPAELTLRETVGNLCQIIGGGVQAKNLWTIMLLRSLESSPAAFENTLLGLIEKLMGKVNKDRLDEFLEEELIENRRRLRMNRKSLERATEVAQIALQRIEDIADDSKLTAFGVLLSHLKEAKTTSRETCVLTEYSATLYYLASEIEGRGMAYRLLHSGMSAETRNNSLSLFSNTAGILIATFASMTTGIALAGVTDLILYDIPGSKMALKRVLSRFDRFGRPSQLNVYVLTGSNWSESIIGRPLIILRDLLSFPKMTQPAKGEA